MKPRFDTTKLSQPEPARREKPCRSKARDLMSDSGLSRSEATLYGLLLAAVGFAFVQQAVEAHAFVAKLPAFASAVAELVRNLV
jgi:hypothetical protein